MLQKSGGASRIIPGQPGVPAIPGRPAVPAYDEVVRSVGRAVTQICLPVIQNGQLVGEVCGLELVPVVTEEVIHHPAVAAVRPTPATPYQPAQLVIDQRFGWQSGAMSIRRLDGDLYTSFQVPTAAGVVIGLNPVSIGEGYLEITHAFYLHGGLLSVIERGVHKWGSASFTPSDVLTIERNAGIVTYRQNGQRRYTSATLSTG
jgi:hypothetical protein